MSKIVPTEARAVVIGGGIGGCSVAYHLTELGWSDVVLLEQDRLTCGTTWHAAGHIGQLKSSKTMTEINRYSAKLYASLEAETGQATGWKQCGSLAVARTADRMTYIKRAATIAPVFGVEAQVVSPKEAGELWPMMRTEDLVGAVWMPSDGRANPVDVTQALAKGAKAGGARIFEGVKAIGVTSKNGSVTGVETDAGSITCEVLVVCAGLWSWEFGRRDGVSVPLHACENFYMVTDSIDGLTPDLPILRDRDGCIYVREEMGGLLLGGIDVGAAKPWPEGPIPEGFSFTLLEDDWDRFEKLMVRGVERVPALKTAGFKQLVTGAESYTPDDGFILGEAPNWRGYFVLAGFSSRGIATAGGAGKALAEWIVAGEPSMDLWRFDIRRFAPFHGDREYLRERVREVPPVHSGIPWPNREMETGRGLRKSPLYEHLAAKRACYGAKMGYERPNWFAPNGVKPQTSYSFGRQNWFDYAAAEHRAAREAVAIFDQSSFAKFIVKGPDAEIVLQKLCSANVAVEPGQLVYTAMLNERGGFESDLTVIRLADNAYFLVTSTARLVRDHDWILRHTPPSASVDLSNVTTDFATIGVHGPYSRKLLGRVTNTDLGNEAFPFGTVREIAVAGKAVRAVRMSFCGELGWELYVPNGNARTVYDSLAEGGHDLGVHDAGSYALQSLRIEMAYRAWGSDIGPDDTPYEAGMGYLADLKKTVPFIGREALLRQKELGIKRRLVSFTLNDPAALLWGNELICRDGICVGRTTSGAYGHTLGRAVALGWVEDEGAVSKDFILSGNYEIEIAGKRFAAHPHLKAPYDPTGMRRKA